MHQSPVLRDTVHGVRMDTGMWISLAGIYPAYCTGVSCNMRPKGFDAPRQIGACSGYAFGTEEKAAQGNITLSAILCTPDPGSMCKAVVRIQAEEDALCADLGQSPAQSCTVAPVPSWAVDSGGYSGRTDPMVARGTMRKKGEEAGMPVWDVSCDF